MGKVVVAILCIVFLFAFAGNITEGIHTFRTDEITQTASVTTGEAGTTGSVVLTRELFNADVSQISSITSDIVETPLIGTYTEATQTLTITNLTVSQTRTLTLIYSSEKEDDYMQVVGPFMLFLIFGGLITAIIYMAYSGLRHRR